MMIFGLKQFNAQKIISAKSPSNNIYNIQYSIFRKQDLPVVPILCHGEGRSGKAPSERYPHDKQQHHTTLRHARGVHFVK